MMWKPNGGVAKALAIIIAAAVMTAVTTVAMADSALIKNAYAKQRVTGIQTVPDGSIKVDGDLSDWGSLADGGVVIDDALDHVLGGLNGSVRGAAAFKIARDSQALYVAIHVVDPHVIPNPGPLYNGDSVLLYFDFRPIDAPPGKPKLGDHDYTDGAYNISIAPPVADPSAPNGFTEVANSDWHPGNTLGKIECAGRLVPDGYTIELEIPYSSMPAVPAGRLDQPFGFDAMVNDVDPDGPRTTGRRAYEWSGDDDAWEDASVLGLVDPGYHPSTVPILRAVPAHHPLGNAANLVTYNTRIIVGGAILSNGWPSPTAAMDVTVQPVANGRMGATVPLLAPRSESTAYPGLGVTIYRRFWQFAELPSGEYVVRTLFPAAKLSESIRFTHVATEDPKALPGLPFPAGVLAANRRIDGGLVLPNGWRITPAGRAIPLPGDMPSGIAPVPGGRYVIVSTGGYNAQGIYVVDTFTDKVVESLPLTQTFGGIYFDPTRGMLYVSRGKTNLDKATSSFSSAISKYRWSDENLLEPAGDVDIATGDRSGCFAAGVAEDAAANLYVSDIEGNRVYRIPANVRPSDDNLGDHTKITRSAGGDTSTPTPYHPYALAISPNGKSLAVANWGDETVSILDPSTLDEQATYHVGSHPNALAYGPDARLFVSNGGSNSVSVITHGQVFENVMTSLDPLDPVGSTPVALVVSPDGKRLYVANADNNDIAVIDISSPEESRPIGFIPTGWYPTALAMSADGKRLYVGVGKGMRFSNNRDHTYIAKLINGALCVVDVPSAAQLAADTRRVMANVPRGEQPQANVAAAIRIFHKIKHVVYIIRENRTYDQVLGDLGKGNSDPSLTIFGADITPNAHKLARSFILLDNLYCNGEVSQDGHQWCDAAYATDFNERAWMNSYSDRPQPDADDRLKDSPAGYLWDNCERHGISFQSFGEEPDFTSSKADLVFTGEGGLKGHANAAYEQLSWTDRDTKRSDIFIHALHIGEKTGVWPQFTVMWLPEDHTHGLSSTVYTPAACVASNDDALGRIVDAISHSRFWKDTAVFVIEDDAQDGQDHVDAHRTEGYFISPFTKHGAVDSTMYTTASFVHTIEIILGLPPMTQFDLHATPLYNAVTAQPILTAYTGLPPQIDTMARNPDGPASIESAKLDFSGPDRADPQTLNRLIWDAMKPGVPMPPVVRSAHR